MGFLTLGGAVDQTAGTWSTLGVPLKSLGYNASNELCGRSVTLKFSAQEADGLFLRVAKEIRENLHFL